MNDPTPPPAPSGDESDVLWYITVDGQRHGPYTEAQMLAFAKEGRLTAESLVWSEGMANWAPWSRVSPWLKAAATATPMPSAAESSPSPRPGGHEAPESPAAEPGRRSHSASSTAGFASTTEPSREVLVARSRQAWLRFFARSVDLFIISMAASAVAFFFGLGSQSQVLLFFAFSVAWIFVEAWFLSRWGMTPGKWIFRIRVVHEEGRLLTFLEARHRATQVLLQGMGLNLFLFSLIFNALAYKELLDFGRTAWDRQRHMEIQTATMRLPHFLVLGLFLILAVAVAVASSAELA